MKDINLATGTEFWRMKTKYLKMKLFAICYEGHKYI